MSKPLLDEVIWICVLLVFRTLLISRYVVVISTFSLSIPGIIAKTDLKNFVMDSNDRSTLYALIVIFIVMSLLCFCVRCWRAGIIEADTSIDQLMDDALRDNVFIAPPEDNLDAQDIEDRRLAILTSVIHKKAITKRSSEHSKDSDSELILPHLDDLSTRSKSKRMMDSDSIIEDIEEGVLDKDNIFVESVRTSTHQSLRSSIMKQESSGDISTFYSPKSCPICLERYKNGDEICWSRNIKCHHAYHLQCILEWLLHSNECPLCRVDYINQTGEHSDRNQTSEQSNDGGE